MSINKNTKIRLRVPKALYESIKAELAKNENYSFDEKPEENESENLNEYESVMQLGDFQQLAGVLGVAVPVAAAIVGTLGVDAVKKLMGKLKGKKAANESEVNEYVSPMELPDMQSLAAVLGVAAPIATALIATVGKDAVKKLYAKLKGKKAAPAAKPEEGGMEEALDLETLMEAVKDAQKKKAEEKKKKEAEAKKKEMEDKKKKKEAEAKKKAAADKKK